MSREQAFAYAFWRVYFTDDYPPVAVDRNLQWEASKRLIKLAGSWPVANSK